MPGNTNQPDPNLPHSVPQNAYGTAGEFTQIFAAGAVPQSAPVSGEQSPGTSADDEFAKMFYRPAAAMGSPAGPKQDPVNNEATLIFEAMPSIEPPVQALPVELTFPTQQQQTAAHAAPRAFESPSSEFTQIFSPIAPPAALPPDVKPAVKQPAQSSGEFTQFFSAISAREHASSPMLPRVVPQGQSSAPAPASRQDAAARPPEDFDRMFPQAPGPSSLPFEQPSTAARTPGATKAQSPDAGTFTQAFQQPSSPELSRNAAPAAAVSSAGGDSFTQVFQQIAPPQARADAAVMHQAPVQPASHRAPTPVPPTAIAGTAQAWPAFGPPSQPSGTFTDVFAAQPSADNNPWPSGPPASAASPQGGAFTEVFQTVPAAPQLQPSSSPFSTLGTSSARGASSTPWPATPQSPVPQPLAGGSGDFTRLMQSLTPAAQGGAPAPSQNDAFFTASPAVGTGTYQESEFTRVQRASSRREAGGAPPAPAAPVVGAAVAPGLAMAPPKEKAAEKEAPAKKSKTLVILLVAMNIFLLLVLIVVAYFVLRRK